MSMFEGTQLSLFEMIELETNEQNAMDSSKPMDETSQLLNDVEALISEVDIEVEAIKAAQKQQSSSEEEEEEEVVTTATPPISTLTSVSASSTSTTKSSTKAKGATKSSVASKVASLQTQSVKPAIESVPLVTEDWKIRYSGTTYYLNLLFEEEIMDGKLAVTLEEIREKLVTTESCTELSPQRAFWEVEEPQKLLVLICKGQTKGGF